MKYSTIFFAIFSLAGCASAQPISQSASEGAPNATTSTQAPAQVAALEQPVAADRTPSFERWVADFRSDAARRGIGARTLDQAFGNVELLQRVIELDRRQPEFTRAVWEYLDTAVSDTRIANGQAKLQANRQAVAAAEQRYGVPGEILVAIWGIESNYGSNFGSFKTVDALATLGFDGRRESFARRELLAALEILQNGDIPRERMQGSWAGGMGHTQFLPSSFQAYAVDADGDGRRDIWASIPDVMGSTANYLARANWQAGQPWGVEVRLPDDFDFTSADTETKMSTAQWAARGVKPVNTVELPRLASASVIAPAGARGPAFLIGPNFHSILRYNNSTKYALAVGHLSDRIAGRPSFAAQWPRGLASLSRTQVTEMQRLLNQKGYPAGTPDGVVGPNTRRALRAWQKDQGLPADGYPTFALLQSLQGRNRQ